MAHFAYRSVGPILLCLIAADQRQERTSCPKTKVGINSMAVMSLNPHMFITGGSDVLGMHLHPTPSTIKLVSCCNVGPL